MDWTVHCYIYGEEVVPTGQIRVEAEESTARIATFTIQPPTGSMDLTWYVGKSMVIDAVVDSVTTRIFAGVVNEPDYDPHTGLLRFNGSDNLQGTFEAMDEATILSTLSGGYYAEAVFGKREDGWQQALDVLSTLPSAVNLDRDGSTLTVTAWAAKQSYDRSFGVADIEDGSLAVEVGRLRELINKITLEAQIRFTRLHHRERTWGWNWGVVSFCDWYLDTFPLPTRDMFQAASEGAGWNVQGAILYETLPDSGSYSCGGGPVGWSISDEAQNQLVTNAAWTAVKRWAQTVTETYQITLQESSSISAHGELLEEQRVGDAVEYDDGSWDASEEPDTPAGFSIDNLGDWYQDQTDSTQTDNTLLTMLNYCRTRILRAHRQSFVQWDMPLLPDIELSETLRLTDSILYATGKVYQTVHNLDLKTGRAVTTIRLAISRGGGGQDAEITSVPTPPDTLDPGPALPSNTVLYNHIGGDDQAPDYDPSWTGFTTNWDTVRGNPSSEQIYPIRLRIETEDIEDSSRDEAAGTATDTIEIYAPDEELVTYGIGPVQGAEDWMWSDTESGPDIQLTTGNLRAFITTTDPPRQQAVTELWLPTDDGEGWYWEVEVDYMGSADSITIGALSQQVYGFAYQAEDGYWLHDGGQQSAFGDPYGAGDTIGIAIKRNDSASRWEQYFSKNGVWQGGGDPEAGTGYLVISTSYNLRPYAGMYNVASVLANFGATTPQYPVPIGFQRLIYS